MDSQNIKNWGCASEKRSDDVWIRSYSYQDFLFSILRVAVGIWMAWNYGLFFAVALLAIVGLGRFFAIISTLRTAAIVNSDDRTPDKQRQYISNLNDVLKRDNFLAVLLPLFAQLLLAAYAVGLLCVYAANSDHKVWLFIVVVLSAFVIGMMGYETVSIVAKDWLKSIEITPDTVFIEDSLWEYDYVAGLFWALLYFVCALFFGYNAIYDPESIVNIVGGVVFTASMIQVLKCVNIVGVCRFGMKGQRKYPIEFFRFMAERRKNYLRTYKKDIVGLSVVGSILIMTGSYGLYLFHEYDIVDMLATVVCLFLSSLVMTIYISGRLFMVPNKLEEERIKMKKRMKIDN